MKKILSLYTIIHSGDGTEGRGPSWLPSFHTWLTLRTLQHFWTVVWPKIIPQL